MKLDVPFYINDGNRCFQACMQSIIKYFLDKDFSLDELDGLTGRKGELWTWPAHVMPVLNDLGLEVKEIAIESPFKYLKGEEYIRQSWSKEDADAIISHTDIPLLILSLKRMESFNLFELRSLSLEDLKDFIDEGNLLLAIIDVSKLNNIDAPYHGHAVIITGYDEEYIYYHDSGPNKPTPDKSSLIPDFVRAAELGEKHQDIIIICGKKQ